MQQLTGKGFARPTKSSSVAPPTPINTQSLRKENKGKDISINLIPVGATGVWQKPADGTVEGDIPPAVNDTTSNQQPKNVVPWATKTATTDIAEQDAAVAPKFAPHAKKNWADVEDEEEEEDEVVDNNLTNSDFKPAAANKDDDTRSSQVVQGNFSEREHREEQDNSNSKSWREGMRPLDNRYPSGRNYQMRDQDSGERRNSYVPYRDQDGMGDGRKGYARDYQEGGGDTRREFDNRGDGRYGRMDDGRYSRDDSQYQVIEIVNIF